MNEKRLYLLIVGSCWFNITQGTRASTSGRNLINSSFRLSVETSYTLPSFFWQKPHKLSLPSSGRNLLFSPFRFPVETSCILPSGRNLINSTFRFPVETSYTLPSFFRQKPYILYILVSGRNLIHSPFLLPAETLYSLHSGFWQKINKSVKNHLKEAYNLCCESVFRGTGSISHNLGFLWFFKWSTI